MGHDALEPLDLGLAETGRRLRDGSLTALALAESFLARVEERNGGAPSFDGAPDAINAWSHLDPGATLAHAREADVRLAGGDPSPLCGIPVAVKDLYAVAGQPLTASSRVRAGLVAESDSAAWAALREAGAVYAGHTHTHEFAAGGTTDQVGNPWNLAHSAGGSSGGSGAAVAAGMVQVALGTDTAGSLRIPAALTGVSSFKPSFGRVPLSGVIPLAVTLDHGGPIARTLEDCAVLVPVLTGAPRAADPWGVGSRPALAAPRTASLRGARLAVTDRAMTTVVDPDVVEGYTRAREAAEALGAVIVELPAPGDLPKADYDTILIAEAHAHHARYAADAGKYRGSTREFVEPGAAPIPADMYLAAQERRVAVTAAWQRWFSEHDIAAVLEPTSATTAPVRGPGYDAGRPVGGTDPLTVFTATWNVTGFPVAALPAGLGSRTRLPVGVSVVGAAGRDDLALALGIALQSRLAPVLVGG